MTKRTLSAKTVTLAHGSGGKAMRDLIEVVFVEKFKNDLLAPLEDQARIQLADLLDIGGQLAITTDSYVVDPIIFPGGNIGTLAVTGTVNDLAVGGAIPKYLTCGMIIEEGFPIDTLRQIAHSMKATADQAGVSIITGDTKVVHKGSADKLFINTAGFGVILPELIYALIKQWSKTSLSSVVSSAIMALLSLMLGANWHLKMTFSPTANH